MDEPLPLLDTPKRKSIQSQADALRGTLKEFERTFAAQHDGRKPSKDDIKADATIAAKYKDYNRLRDVLAGKLGLEALNAHPLPPRRKQEQGHAPTDHGARARRPRHCVQNTPSKAHARLHPSELDPYDAPSSVSPKVILSAIGPTPRRDGTVLGIFDLLPRSGSGLAGTTTSRETPSSRKRKRKIDSLAETQEAGSFAVAQTPSHRRDKGSLSTTTTTTTPRSCLKTGRRQHSKTPVSEGKRFMLNHFFATPSAVRFATIIDADDEDTGGNARTSPQRTSKTPLRDIILGATPSRDNRAEVAADATPPYLKRSFSFKERLLSASTGSNPASASASAPGLSSWKMTTNPTGGPRMLRHGRTGAKPLSQMIAELHQSQSQSQSQSQNPEQAAPDEHDDDLDALREMESDEVNVLVGDSQVNADPARGGDDAAKAEPTTTWKKKGQKRTTRRVMMRPVRMKPADAPKFVAAEDDDDNDDQDELSLDNEHPNDDDDDAKGVTRVEESQFDSNVGPDLGSDPDLDYLIAEAEQQSQEDLDPEDDFVPEHEQTATPAKKRSTAKTKTKTKTKHQTGSDAVAKPASGNKGKKSNSEEDATTRKINPNAYSHMNFRSLKIKNKNSKAKGRGRFGKGRR